MYFLILIILISVGNVKCNPIVNGYDARENEFPFIVSIRNAKHNHHICGGSIISDIHVITAAHCFNEPNTIKNTIVVAGTNSKTEKPLVYHIEKLHDYSKWPKKRPGYHDVLILTLIERIDIRSPNSRVKNIALPREPLEDNSIGTLAGWGLAHRNIEPDNLQKLTTRILSVKFCTDIHKMVFFNSAFEICVRTGSNKGICNGDSGGPLVSEIVYGGVIYKVLVGIIEKSTEPCATGAPDVLANVYMYLDFIDEVFVIENTHVGPHIGPHMIPYMRPRIGPHCCSVS